MKRCIVSALVIGCGSSKPPSIEDALEKYGAAVEPIVAQAEAIAKQPRPALAADGSQNGVTLDGPPIELHRFSGGSKATKYSNLSILLEAYADNLVKGNYAGGSDFGDYANVVTNCASVIRTKKKAQGPSEYDTPNYLEACTHLEYLGILRTRRNSSGSENHAAGTFTGGSFEGDVLIYRLSTGKYLGGFTVGAEQTTKTVQVNHQSSDYTLTIQMAVDAALVKYAGAKR